LVIALIYYSMKCCYITNYSDLTCQFGSDIKFWSDICQFGSDINSDLTYVTSELKYVNSELT